MHIRAQINHARRHATFSAAALRKAGYTQIGRGAFSTAFVHPDAPDVVIKVGRAYSRRVGYYDGFPYFAQQLIDGVLRSKFFPRVYDFEWSADRSHFFCLMRRYRKTARNQREVANDMQATLKKITGEKPYTGNYKGRFRKAMEQLVDFRLIPDIHAGNVMRDRHDTPIVIDPILVRSAYQQSVYA